jgi:hypothetical protein
MTSVLLDTDVFSYFFKRDSRAALYAPDVAAAQLCLSFQSVAELRSWSLIRNWGNPRRQSLEAAILRCVVLPMTTICRGIGERSPPIDSPEDFRLTVEMHGSPPLRCDTPSRC